MAIQLSKNGNAVKFDFDDNSHYLNDGTIEVPVNSLTLVTDESNMFTFKKAASDDIFISGLYSEIGMSKAELIAWYKDNMVGSTGGGVTSGEVQTMIDESVSGLSDDISTVSGDVSTLSGDVANKADTTAVTASINAAVSGKMDTSAFNTYSASTDARISEDEEVTSAALNELNEALSGKQDTLIAGTNITISGNVISAEGGSITVDSAFSTISENPLQNRVITNNTLSGRVEQNDSFRSFRFWNNNGSVAFYKRYAAINGRSVLGEGTASAPEFNLVETSAITSSVTTASTDSQVPSAKAVYDALQGGGGGNNVIELTQAQYDALTDIDPTAFYIITDAQSLEARLAEDEEVTAAALNELNNKYSTIETTIGDINTILQSI